MLSSVELKSLLEKAKEDKCTRFASDKGYVGEGFSVHERLQAAVNAVKGVETPITKQATKDLLISLRSIAEFKGLTKFSAGSTGGNKSAKGRGKGLSLISLIFGETATPTATEATETSSTSSFQQTEVQDQNAPGNDNSANVNEGPVVETVQVAEPTSPVAEESVW